MVVFFLNFFEGLLLRSPARQQAARRIIRAALSGG